MVRPRGDIVVYSNVYQVKNHLKGKGFPVYKEEGKFGDLYVTYKVEIPKSISEEEKALFEQLSKLKTHGTN